MAEGERRRSNPFAESFFPFETGDLNAASWGLHEALWNIVLVVGTYGVGEAVINFDSGLFTERKGYLEAQSAEDISVLTTTFERWAEEARCS
jgi:hypothetical protein